MKVLHLVPGKAYQSAELIADHVNETNRLAVVEIDGVKYMTGGHILPDDPAIRMFLDQIGDEYQYDIINTIRQIPTVETRYKITDEDIK